MLTVKRPGGALNAAVAAGTAFPKDLVIETLMRLDLVYRETSEPFGLGVAYQSLTGGRSAVLFGFKGTRRADSIKDPSRKHMTEVAFYDVSEQKRVRLGDSVLTYQGGYQLGEWYHVKLMVEGGDMFKGKIWRRGSKEPDWMYEEKLAQPKNGAI